MGTWSLLGGILSVAIGVVQLLSGDWSGALWSLAGVAIMLVRRQWR